MATQKMVSRKERSPNCSRLSTTKTLIVRINQLLPVGVYTSVLYEILVDGTALLPAPHPRKGDRPQHLTVLLLTPFADVIKKVWLRTHS